MRWPDDYVNRVICGDCLEVMKGIPDGAVDLVVTDPPYGIDLNYDGCNTRNLDRDIAGDSTPFDPLPMLRFPRLVMWGGNNFADKLPQGGWLVWDKRIRNDKSDLANQCDGELAWTNLTKRILIFRHLWIGAFRASEHTCPIIHPTQKPIALMAWIIDKYSKPDQIILDPFAGSGTTLVAAKQLGRRYIGIEINPDYCRIAEQRLSQEELFGVKSA